MGFLVLTDQPQAINAGGLQGDTLFYNEGPDTAYLDSNSSINPTYSVALPPLASIVWRGGQPLWAVSRGDSKLRTAFASEASLPNTATRQQTLLQLTSFPSGSTAVHEILECANYQSLFLTFYNSDTWDILNAYKVDFDWYDSNGNYLTTDTYYPGAAIENQPVRMTIPVAGSFFVTWITPPGGSVLSNLTITGLTDKRSTALEPSYATSLAVPATDRNCPIKADTGVTITGRLWAEDWAQFVYNGAVGNFAFHAKSQNLIIVFNFTAAVTVAGSFVINTIGGNFPLCTTQDIPVGATRRHAFEIKVPRAASCYFQVITPPTAGAGVTNMELIWR